MPTQEEPIIAKFLQIGRILEPAYRSARIRTLFADRGSGTVSSVITRVHLLVSHLEKPTVKLWESKSLKVCERIISFQSLDDLFNSFISGGVELDSIHVGFYETEEANWTLRTIAHLGSQDYANDFTALALVGSVKSETSLKGNEPHFLNEMQLNVRGTYSSISELTQDYLGKAYDDLQTKLVEIITPFYLRVTELQYHGNRVRVKIHCRRETISELKAWAQFLLSNGEIIQFQPRFRNLSLRELGDGSVIIDKTFNAPPDTGDAFSVRVTVSAGGIQGIALDSNHCIRWPVPNVIRSSIDFLDSNKVGKYFSMRNFENTYTSLGGGDDDKILESVVAVSLTSLGLTTLWTGVFKLSCEDLLAFVPGSNRVLVIECTTGTATRKIGLMTTALRNLRQTADWYDFIGVIITSNYASNLERNNASQKGIVLLDVTELKALVQMASELPNPKKVLDLMGIT